MAPPIYTKYYPLYDTFEIADFAVAPPQRIVLFNGNPQAASYPQNRDRTNMARQGEIPQGVGFVGKTIKLIAWLEFPGANSGDVSRAAMRNLATLIKGMSAQIQIENTNEFRNYPLETILELPYHLRTYSPLAAAVDPGFVWQTPQAGSFWGGTRVGARLAFGNLPQPREPGESEAAYRARLAARRPPLVPLVLRPQQRFSLILQQDNQFAGWDADATINVMLRAVIDGQLTTDLDLATGTPRARALGAPSDLLTPEVQVSPDMAARLAGSAQPF